MRGDGPVRVLVVDQSPLFGRLLGRELDRHSGVQVVARACDAWQTREHVLEHRPDVILLDLELARADNYALLRRLRIHYPVPIIVCSRIEYRIGPYAMRAVGLGALEVVAKPDPQAPDGYARLAAELATKIRVAASEVRPVPVRTLTQRLQPPLFRSTGLNPARYLVAIGASTGGPEAVLALLAAAPPDFPSVVNVQHMPAGFTLSFAQRLDEHSALSVGEARDGEIIVPGRAVIARGDTHLVVRPAAAGWRVLYTDQRPVNRHCPSVDVLFESVAAVAGPRAVGVLLTGMGEDGAHGLLRMREAGAVTIAQDRNSSVVYGMPKVAVEIRAATHTARPEQIPALVQRLLLKREGRGAAARGHALR